MKRKSISPVFWGLALSYIFTIAAALMIPDDVSSSLAGVDLFVELMQRVVPMIQRVESYGLPQTGKLKLFLALAWLVVSPICILCLLREYRLSKPWIGAKEIRIEALLLLVLLTAGIFFFYWFWPNLHVTHPLAPVTRQFDDRMKLLGSNFSLALWTPLWLLCSWCNLGCGLLAVRKMFGKSE